MKIVKCSKDINEIVKLMTSESFLSLNPTLAGGFVKWLYDIECQRTTEYIKKTILTSYSLREMYNNGIKNSAGFQGKYPVPNSAKILSLCFTDIDSWFKDDNDIWNENSEFNLLVSSIKKDDPVESKSRYESVFDKFFSESTSDEAKPSIGLEKCIKNIGFTSLGCDSIWARTFLRNLGINFLDSKLQIIKKPYSSISKLMDSFDLNVCKIAWRDGSFFISDSFLESRKIKEIVISDNWDISSYFQKAQTVIRAFKYSSRTGFDISEDSIDKIFRLYMKENELRSHMNDDDIHDASYDISIIERELKLLNPETSDAVFTYGGEGTINTIKRQNKLLVDHFPLFVIQKYFNKSMIPYFLNSESSLITKIIKCKI
jgi:hypothetical protein